MLTAEETLNRYYHEMRWRLLSLAADFDRLQRAQGGEKLLQSDPRLKALRECLNEVLSTDVGRAERVQMILSDRTPVL
ncbi:MAG: hypothetical protein KatS3mg104_0270 [Phycisphaerae bacterium]|jgi:hypothetical protein|nr:MAG: hypothetical protein KatS3mg104_0270 [Phycisphaerae bacterium]